jgi:hypothetical protein
VQDAPDAGRGQAGFPGDSHFDRNRNASSGDPAHKSRILALSARCPHPAATSHTQRPGGHPLQRHGCLRPQLHRRLHVRLVTLHRWANARQPWWRRPSISGLPRGPCSFWRFAVRAKPRARLTQMAGCRARPKATGAVRCCGRGADVHVRSTKHVPRPGCGRDVRGRCQQLRDARESDVERTPTWTVLQIRRIRGA